MYRDSLESLGPRICDFENQFLLMVLNVVVNMGRVQGYLFLYLLQKALKKLRIARRQERKVRVTLARSQHQDCWTQA